MTGDEVNSTNDTSMQDIRRSEAFVSYQIPPRDNEEEKGSVERKPPDPGRMNMPSDTFGPRGGEGMEFVHKGDESADSFRRLQQRGDVFHGGGEEDRPSSIFGIQPETVDGVF